LAINGNVNDVRVAQGSNSQTANATINGSGNTLESVQIFSGGNNQLNVSVSGNNNDLTNEQFNSFGSATMNINGNENSVGIFQPFIRTVGATATITVTGNTNNVSSVILDDSGIDELTVHGNGNSVHTRNVSQGFSNSARALVVGNNNDLRIRRDSNLGLSTGNTANTDILGNNNEMTINQNGADARSINTITGNTNIVTQDQAGLEGGDIDLAVTGSGNEIHLVQLHDNQGKLGTTAADIIVVGDRNILTANQQGLDNLLTAQQLSNDNSILVNQTGSGNEANIFQP
jgi:hypothetical protein